MNAEMNNQFAIAAEVLRVNGGTPDGYEFLDGDCPTRVEMVTRYHAGDVYCHAVVTGAIGAPDGDLINRRMIRLIKRDNFRARVGAVIGWDKDSRGDPMYVGHGVRGSIGNFAAARRKFVRDVSGAYALGINPMPRIRVNCPSAKYCAGIPAQYKFTPRNAGAPRFDYRGGITMRGGDIPGCIFGI